MKPPTSFVVLFVLFASTASAQTAGVTRDVWSGRFISNMQSLVDNPAYLGTPTSTSVNSVSFQQATLNDTSGRFVARYVARVTAPTTGNYFFWINCNYKCMLWYSPTPSFAGRAPIARMMQATAPPPGWGGSALMYAEQRSLQIPLTAGQSYYLLAVHVEDGNNINHFGVGWWYPTGGGKSGVYERPIPASRLTAYNYPSTFNFAATPPVVDPGQNTTLTWSSYGYTSCSGSNDKGAAWSGSQPLSGSTSVAVSVPTKFTLTCTGPPGTSAATAEVAIYYTDTVSIAWDPNTEPDITGYYINSGITSGTYTTQTNAGKVTEFRMPPFPQSGRYYFTVQAYSPSGISPNSMEVYADIKVSQTLVSTTYLVSSMTAPKTSTSPSAPKGKTAEADTPPTATTAEAAVAETAKSASAQTDQASASTDVPTVRFFAEGANNDYFHTEYVLFNPNQAPIEIKVEYQLSGTNVWKQYAVPAKGRLTVDTAAIPELSKTTFATTMDALSEFAVERKLTATGVGTSLQNGTGVPMNNWYVAEGTTGAYSDLYYLIQNPYGTEPTVSITYLLPNGRKINKSYQIPRFSRYTLAVDGVSGLSDTQPAAIIRSDYPIVVERSMYMSSASAGYGAVMQSAAVSALSNTWHFAEGGTGPFFDLYLNLLNPQAADAQVRVRYLLTNGQEVVKDYTVPAEGRSKVFVDKEDPQLANVALSMTIDSSLPIAAERTMTWSGGTDSPKQMHNSAGVTAVAAKWAVAEAEVGGETKAETFVSILNLSDQTSFPSIKLVFDDGTSDLISVEAKAHARTTVDVRNYFAAANRRFSIVVEDLNPSSQLAVESTTYRAQANRLGAMVGSSHPATPIR